MSRPLRIDVENGWYHICSRGIEQRQIFLTPVYYRHFIELLEQMSCRYGVETHAYCLMPNHYHVIIRTPSANASRAVQWLNVSYAAWFNAKRERVGHVFQGRFKSVLIDGDGAWLLLASEYLHLNPVRTKAMGLGKAETKAQRVGSRVPSDDSIRKRIEKLRGYKWSSYCCYAGFAVKPGWLHTDEIIRRAGGKGKYRKSVECILSSGADPAQFESLRGRLAIGSVDFIEKSKKLAGKVTREHPERKLVRSLVSFDRIVELVEKEKREEWASFCERHGDWGRDAVLYLARQRSGLTYPEICERAGIENYKAAEKAVERFRKRMQKDRDMRRVIERCLAQMSEVGT